MRFKRCPAGDRAAECLSDREARAPEVGEVLAVVELRSDGEIVVRRQLISGSRDGSSSMIQRQLSFV